MSGVHGWPSISSTTDWMPDGLAGEPVSVQTSCAATWSRIVAAVLGVTAPPRFTVAVAPSTDGEVRSWVLPGNALLAPLASQDGCGGWVSPFTRLMTSCDADAPSGTSTESGTRTRPGWPEREVLARKYRSCAL